MPRRSAIDPAVLASTFFATTVDLNAAFPAYAARRLGWLSVPLMCGHEMAVPGDLPRCIRILLHLNTDKPQSALRHAYLCTTCHAASALATVRAILDGPIRFLETAGYGESERHDVICEMVEADVGVAQRMGCVLTLALDEPTTGSLDERDMNVRYAAS